MIQISAQLLGALLGALFASTAMLALLGHGLHRAWKRADGASDALRTTQYALLDLLKAYDAGDPINLDRFMNQLRGKPRPPDAPMWLARRGRPPVKPGRRLYVVGDDSAA